MHLTGVWKVFCLFDFISWVLSALERSTDKQEVNWRGKVVLLYQMGLFRASNYPNCHLGTSSTDGQPAFQAIRQFLYICAASDLQKDILVKATGITLWGHPECRHTMSINSTIAVITERTNSCQPGFSCYLLLLYSITMETKKQWAREQTKISFSWHRLKPSLIAFRLSAEGSSPPGM